MNTNLLALAALAALSPVAAQEKITIQDQGHRVCYQRRAVKLCVKSDLSEVQLTENKDQPGEKWRGIKQKDIAGPIAKDKIGAHGLTDEAGFIAALALVKGESVVKVQARPDQQDVCYQHLATKVCVKSDGSRLSYTENKDQPGEKWTTVVKTQLRGYLSADAIDNHKFTDVDGFKNAMQVIRNAAPLMKKSEALDTLKKQA